MAQPNEAIAYELSSLSYYFCVSFRLTLYSNFNFSANCYAISVRGLSLSLSGPLPGNGNANTIRTKQSNELDDATTTSSLNTLFGSRLDKPSAGHHNCVELEIHTASRMMCGKLQVQWSTVSTREMAS